MAYNSGIEWTDTTWNPVTGCTKVSPGCDFCYAERISERFRGVENSPFKNGFDLTFHPKRMDQPKTWSDPRMVFVNSMSDLFHKDIPWHYIDSIFTTMEIASQHTYQILTKRSSRMRNYVNNRYENAAPPHIWLGVSVEDDKRLSRIEHLKDTKATVRFISFEPLLGPVDDPDLEDIHWAIVGGESGSKHRYIDPDWVRSLRDSCKEQNVAFFFKQWGGKTAKEGGNVLDGKTYMEYPKVA